MKILPFESTKNKVLRQHEPSTRNFKKFLEKPSKEHNEKKKKHPSPSDLISVEENKILPFLVSHDEKEEDRISLSCCLEAKKIVSSSYESTLPVAHNTDESRLKDLYALMEKVGAEMMIMSSEDVTTTSLHLIKEKSLSSLFANATISIEEFSFAPKVYNIKIIASPEAISLIRTHQEEFLKLFQERKFGFSINRIDTEISSSRPLFSRKEEVCEDEDSDQKGSQHQ
jgi:hypothetical protein